MRRLTHVQRPVGMGVLSPGRLFYFGWLAAIPTGFALLLAVMQLPLTSRIMLRLREPRYMAFGLMSFVRAFWRGVGMTHGTLGYLLVRGKR